MLHLPSADLIRPHSVATGQQVVEQLEVESYRQKNLSNGPDINLRSEIARAAKETDTHPTEAEKQSGRHRKGKFQVHGFTIAIENPAGSIRSGVDRNGKPWSVVMKSHYGYILRTESEADGDHVDVVIGPDPEEQTVYVIDQVNPDTGQFDEHKCMLGYRSAAAAKTAYLANYAYGWQGFAGIQAMSIEEFRQWLKGEGTGKPVTDLHGSVKDLSWQNEMSGGALVPPPAQGPRFRKRKSVLSLADFKVLRLKYRSKAWITVGGHPCEDGEGQHCEGTRVEVGEGGKVRKGPAKLRGQKLKREKKPAPKPSSSFQESRTTPTEQEKPTAQPAQEAPPQNKPKAVKPVQSKAKVYSAGIEAHTHEALKDLLGNTDLGQIASLVGAPDDADVYLNVHNYRDPKDRKLVIRIVAHEFEAERHLSRDDQGKLFMENDSFVVKPQYQKDGIGTRVFSQQVALAQEKGVTYIKCFAGYGTHHGVTFNGYYTWPRMGYDSPIDKLDHHVQERIKKDHPEAKSVLDIMATPGGRDWWKKNGGEIKEAKFDMTPGSRSLQTLEKYLADRQQR